MTLQDGWQALFAPHILRRGKDYWQQGRVKAHACKHMAAVLFELGGEEASGAYDSSGAISPAKRHAGRDQEASKARPAAQYGQLVVYHLNLRKKPSGFGCLSEKPEGVFYPVVHAAAPCG